MKLVLLATLLGFVLVKAQSQKIHHEQLPLPPQYQRPFNGAFPSESSQYLPPENHSPLPYFPMKNIDRLQYQYLPPSGTKAPPIYQTPFPLIISSIPNFDDDESDEDDNNNKVKSTPQGPENNQNNRTESQVNYKKERSLPQTVSYRHPIDRADIKFPFQMGNFAPPPNQPPLNRRMIIAPETKRSDHMPDQIKAAAAFQANHFINPPSGFSVSTTEPAIPILRLSNEMDLDGSYSYEALGADQTHYVQHSRMENMGTDKEEQVVEGSYSYVGDNGQTYTVHYVADANGFRASGEHLPVAPPVPEIIQRAVQYNLAEEAKRPPHQKSSWQDDERENVYYEKEKNHHFVLPAQQQLPPRNLFTGRAPEAFSHTSVSHGSNQEDNNLVTASSNLAPVKTVDFKQEPNPNKPNAGPIAPQITFLASQGAHVPALNAPPQPSISRMFTTERLPQLMNYEAVLRENEPETKGLWRWQYGINSSNNETPAKSTISRSSFSGDDIMINFSDMTPEQYTSMIRSQYDTDTNNGNGVELQQRPSDQGNQNAINEYEQQYQNQQQQFQNFQLQEQNNLKLQQSEFATHRYIQQQSRPETIQQNLNKYHSYQQPQQSQYDQTSYQSTPVTINYQTTAAPLTSTTPAPTTQAILKRDSQIQSNHNLYQNNQQYNVKPSEHTRTAESRHLIPNKSHQGIVTRQHFIPPSQTITQSYDYEDENFNIYDFYEARKMKSYNLDTLKILSSTMAPMIMQTIQPQQDQTQTLEAQNQQTQYSKDQQMQYSQAQNYQTENVQNQITKSFESQTLHPVYEHTSTKNEPFTEAIKPSESSIYIPSSTASSLKFSDFIVKEQEEKFTPITSAPAEAKDSSTTTTENSIEEMFENNIFLKNMFSVNKNEANQQNSINDNTKVKELSKPLPVEHKTEKPSKQTFSKAFQYTKTTNRKPLDISQVLHYVAHKNGFEPIKVKPKNKPIALENLNLQQRSEPYYTNTDNNKSHEKDGNRNVLSPRQQEELRGVIKNYKVLQRNNNVNSENNQYKPDYIQPLRILELQPSNTPPLGRAGPTVKAYLPPIYV